MLSIAGLSYMDAACVLSVAPCSHEAVRLWVKQLTLNVKARPRR
jgi:hypothetical protein